MQFVNYIQHNKLNWTNKNPYNIQNKIHIQYIPMGADDNTVVLYAQ